jgi:chromosome segregation ATPase
MRRVLWIFILTCIYLGNANQVVRRTAFQFPSTGMHKVFTFLSFGFSSLFRRNDKIWEAKLTEFELKIKELEMIVLSLQIERDDLKKQLQYSKESIQKLRKDKMSIQASFEKQIKQLTEKFEREKKVLKEYYGELSKKELKDALSKASSDFDKDKQTIITNMKELQRKEREEDQKAILDLTKNLENNVFEIEKVKKQFHDESSLLENTKRDSEKKEKQHKKV